ncbi:MAG: copper-binding protein [Opitutaceae bacterium]
MMKSFRSKTLTFAAALASVLLFAACQEKPAATADAPDAGAAMNEAASEATAAAAAMKQYPLRGVVLEVDASAPSLLVKHEEIPGYMAAMTMQIPVDAEAAARVKKDQTITATLVVEAGGFHLGDVKVVEDASPQL